MIAIVNYFMGNLQSVANILEYLKVPCQITNRPEDIRAADRIILPGVGAFNEAMKNLEKLNLIPLIREEVIEKRKPFLGICLGMQLMADRGTEGGETPGLGLIPGEIRRFELEDKRLPIPHVGWNDVEPAPNSKLYAGSDRKRIFYFVHSYHFICREEKDVAGYTDYGGRFVSSIERGNIFGTQFHPEKSQQDGLELLRNFLAYK